MEYMTWYLVLAAAFGLFMAWGIGANDVANAMATSVGARALTIKQAIIITVFIEWICPLVELPQIVKPVPIRIQQRIRRIVFIESIQNLPRVAHPVPIIVPRIHPKQICRVDLRLTQGRTVKIDQRNL